MNNLSGLNNSGINNFETGDPAVSNTGKNRGKFKTNNKLTNATNIISKNSIENLQKDISNATNKIANKVNKGFEKLKSKIQARGTEKFFESLELQFIKAKNSPEKQKEIIKQIFNWIADPKNHNKLEKHQAKFLKLQGAIYGINKSLSSKISEPFVLASINDYSKIKPLDLNS